VQKEQGFAGRKDDGQVIKVDEDLQVIWYDKYKVEQEDLQDLEERGIIINL